LREGAERGGFYMESTLDNKNIRNEIRDQRKHQRQDFSYTVVEYVLDPGTTHRIFIGFTLDLSYSGLCIYTTKLLNEGQEVMIKNNFFVPSQTATVRWVEKSNDDFYKIGLMFI
jgi:hypothetical protein